MKINTFEGLIKYINRYRNNPKKISILKEKFTKYLDLCDEKNIMDFINEIKSIPEMERTLYYKSDDICKKFGIQIILKMTQGLNFEERYRYIYEMYEGFRLKYYTIDEFVENLLAGNEIEYICSNIEKIINCSDIQLLTKKGLLKKLKQLNPEEFKTKQSAIVCKMIGGKSKYLGNRILYGLTTIVNDISRSENTDLSDLEYIGTGAFTNVYKLGNKVIKLGKSRITDKIPYHRRILQPLIRRNVFLDLYVEISEYIQPDITITDEDAYLIYKELRDDGIIWLDAKKENLGRLEKENITYFNESLYETNEIVGYIPETLKKDTPLQKGELVIIDTDMLFREKDFDEYLLDRKVNRNFYRICEQRYQEERKSKVNNEFIDKLENIEER